MNVAYDILIRKLDEFTRKYYRNQLLKGLILFLAVLFISFLLVSGLEYFGHFGMIVRTVLFYLFLVLNSSLIAGYIVMPLLRLWKIGKILTYEQASVIIGRHFPEIGDKLLNTLQLTRLYRESIGIENLELLRAGIDQKIERLRPIPFTLAIDLKKNRKFLKYALPPILAVLLLLTVAPSLITRPADRLIHHTQTFADPAPFRMIILNPSLTAFQQEDFVLKVKVAGDVLPEELFLESEGVSYKFNRETPILFTHTFKTLQRSRKFTLSSGKYRSDEYELKVFPKPVILNFETTLTYPGYLGRKPELVENTGDLIIPEGTVVSWRFFTKDVDEINLIVDSTEKRLVRSGSNVIGYAMTAVKNTRYTVSARNAYAAPSENLAFGITVIPDGWPAISIDELKDSTLPGRSFYQGIVKDDYGISGLTFHYEIVPAGDTTLKHNGTDPIPFNGSLNQQQFFYVVDGTKLAADPGDAVRFYFEVCDNDGIHGHKCSRSALFTYKAPTLDELNKQVRQSERNIAGDLEAAVRESQRLQKQIDDLKRKLIDAKSISWQDKKQIEDLLERQNQLKEKVEEIRQENEKKNNLEEQFKPPDSTLLEKQKQLDELFNSVMDEETKKMMEELRKMLEKLDKEKVSEMLEKMKMSSKDMEKELDRNLELFRQLEFEKQLAESIEKLNQLAEKQEQLAKETEQAESTPEELKEQQKAIQEAFSEQKEQLEELKSKNQALEEPNAMPDMNQEQKTASEEMNNSSESLQNNNRKKASGSQKKAAQALKNMAEKLSAMKEGMEQEQAEEDAEMLRSILQNLVRVSFDQEELMSRTKVISRTDPRYLLLIQDQNDLKEDLALIEDSLYALAKRQAMIKPFIMKEIETANQNLTDAVKGLNDRNLQTAGAKQQFVMTSVNNLALMLSEVLKQMESNMESQKSKPGSKACKKGKSGGKMSMKSMRQMQQNLNKKMQELKKEMESMNKGGQGKQKTPGQQKMSEQLARIAAEQEAIRSEMRKYMDQMNEQGIKDGGALNDAMNRMEQTQKDLVNKRILQETLNRQQEILTRMLESEKAEQQREQEEKREATEAKNQKISNSFSEIQYKKLTSPASDLLKTVQPKYNYFYKNKINSYFLKFER